MENYINLLDGTRLEATFNFGTMYYLIDSGADKIVDRINRKKKAGQKPTNMEYMKASSKMIYAILRSNGKQVTVDEAMSLVPPDMDEVQNIVNIFEKQLEKYKKKEMAKKNMKKTFH